MLYISPRLRMILISQALMSFSINIANSVSFEILLLCHRFGDMKQVWLMQRTGW